MSNNSVIFKGKKDGLTVLLEEGCDFEEIKASLEEKLVSSKKFFDGAVSSIEFKGRELSENEERELLDIIAKKTSLSISFVVGEKKDDVPKEKEPLSKILDVNNLDESITKFHRGSLRSGQYIHFDGSVVILGDVNPGAEIIASGNIIILGVLKGMVHAGCNGDTNSIVMALNLLPVQLRIANSITYLPEEVKKKESSVISKPSYAYIDDGQIYITSI